MTRHLGSGFRITAELRGGTTADAFYYAEPIEAKGAPDAYFPQFKKDGWREGEIIGAVVARVSPAEAPGR